MGNRARLLMSGSLVAAMLMALVVGWRMYHEHRHAMTANEAVIHTLGVVDDLHALRAYVTQAESASRGFALSGDEGYLAPYHSSREKLDELLQRTRLAAAPDAKQLERWTHLEELIEARFDIFSQVIAATLNGGQGAAINIVRTGRGRALSSEIMDALTALEQDQLWVNEKQKAQVRQANERVRQLALGGSGLQIVLLSVVGLVFWREQQTKRAT